MKRRALLASAAALACRARDRRPRLNVFSWSNYVAPDTVPRFEAEFGVRVRYATYESNEEMLAKVMSGNSGWDVVFPSNYVIAPMRELRLLAPVRHHLLPNLGQLEPRFQTPPWDPGLGWSVPYMWGASGIAYQRSVRPEPAAWADLWRADLAGHMTMLDDSAEVLGASLKLLGYSINSADPVQLAAARREAMRQKPLLRAYLNAEVRDQLVAGDVLAAQLWATTAQQAMDASSELRFAYPSEGFALYCDNAVILRESARQELAHDFINYLLRPATAAAIVAAARTATANGGARALLEPLTRSNPVLYPDEETLRKGEWFDPLPPAAQRLRDRIWTEIKSA